LAFMLFTLVRSAVLISYYQRYRKTRWCERR